MEQRVLIAGEQAGSRIDENFTFEHIPAPLAGKPPWRVCFSSMQTSNSPSTEINPLQKDRFVLRWFGVILALTIPTVFTWAYFVLASRYSTGAQQATYLVVKVIQFGLPIFWVWAVLREPIQLQKPNGRGLALGALFSLLVVGSGWLLFDRVLDDGPLFANAAPMIRAKIAGFGISSLAAYAALGIFYSAVHSLLEEYYWRWFTFGQLRRLLPLGPAVLISALGFMGHHVVVLHQFFPDKLWLALLLSAGVGIGGVFWAWLYDRTGSLYGPWLSHALIDAGIFWIGYDLVRDTLALSP